MAPLVWEYYVLLRSTLRTKPHLRQCLGRCRHGRIFFLTPPRNAGRRELLRCSVGCRQEQRRRESLRRSPEYYRGEQGREYQRRQNPRQRGQVEIVVPKPPKASAPPPSAKSPCSAEIAEALPAAQDPEVVKSVRVVVSLMEHRSVSLEEIGEMRLGVVRQRRMPPRRPIDHAVAWLKANPP